MLSTMISISYWVNVLVSPMEMLEQKRSTCDIISMSTHGSMAVIIVGICTKIGVIAEATMTEIEVSIFCYIMETQN